MINILIPLCGDNTFNVSNENKYPKLLNEIHGKLFIERASKPFFDLNFDSQIIVALPKSESMKYQLNNMLKLLGDNIKTCTINGSTEGSACSALLAMEELDLDSPLIISSFEQILEFDINSQIKYFIDKDVDAGVLTFEAIHPKWSYVKVNENGFVTQAAEKKPISNKAIAGLYYFKTASLFIESAKAMIRKDARVNDKFFIAPCLNEIILDEGTVVAVDIDKNHYFHVSDENELKHYEKKILENSISNKSIIQNKTKDYIDAFNSKDIDKLTTLFSVDIVLVDPIDKFENKLAVKNYIQSLFNKANALIFKEINTYVTDTMHTVIEFELFINDDYFVGTDIIKWNNKLEIKEINAYLYEKNNG